MQLTVGMIKKHIESLDDNMPVRVIADHSQVATVASCIGLVWASEDEWICEDWVDEDDVTEIDEQEKTLTLLIGD